MSSSQIYFFSSFLISILTFTILYIFGKYNYTHIRREYKYHDTAEFANDSSNFLFSILTTLGTSYDIFFNFDVLFPSNNYSIIHSHHPIFDKWILVTLGYLCVDLFSMYFITSRDTSKRRIHYLVFHSVIFFAYLSVLLNQTGIRQYS
jgi:magnesium-transporting ATPase (P-type)